jgi:hypothetical protein
VRYLNRLYQQEQKKKTRRSAIQQISNLLNSDGISTSAVNLVRNRQSGKRVLRTKDMRAGRLVANIEVKRTDLVVAECASAVGDVVERRIVTDPRADGAADERVDAIGGHEGQLAVRGLDEIRAVAHRGVFPLGIDATAHGGLLGSPGTDVEVVPGIVADVEGTTRGVDLEQVDGAAIRSDLLAKRVTTRLHGPVRNTVSVDMAAEYADGGAETVVGGDRDTGREGDGGH